MVLPQTETIPISTMQSLKSYIIIIIIIIGAIKSRKSKCHKEVPNVYSQSVLVETQ